MLKHSKSDGEVISILLQAIPAAAAHRRERSLSAEARTEQPGARDGTAPEPEPKPEPELKPEPEPEPEVGGGVLSPGSVEPAGTAASGDAPPPGMSRMQVRARLACIGTPTYCLRTVTLRMPYTGRAHVR
jgi:hypothetical protein